MDQLINIEKVSEFNLLKKLVKEFMSSWSQSLVNARGPNYLKQKIFNIVYTA